MGFYRAARKRKALITGSVASFFCFFLLYDQRNDENLKNYTYYEGNYAKIQIVEQNQT